jgi:hypothetical protein
VAAVAWRLRSARLLDWRLWLRAVREKIDGLDSVLDFANLIDLPPRFVDGLRDRLVCLPRLNAERSETT